MTPIISPGGDQTDKPPFWMHDADLGSGSLLDRLRIRELVEYERYCYDYGLREQQRLLWHPDAEIFTTWYHGPASGYLQATPGGSAPKTQLESHAHRINNTVVWVHQDRAIAELLCTLAFRTLIRGEWVDLQCWTRMHYRLERRHQRWGILYFEGIYEKDRSDPIFGDSVVAVPRDELQQRRPINWNMAVRRGSYAGGTADELAWAGRDIPDTIARLYTKSSAWLSEQ